MTKIDLTKWSKRNVWPTADGQLAVRPGLRRIATPTAGRRWVAGFSAQNPWTLDVWHYVADVSTAGHDLVVRIFDDDWVEWQAFSTGVDGIPRGFSHGVVEGEIMVGGAGMPTLWGYVGGPLALATKVASDNPGTTAINVPSGIVAAVLNRIVIADGASLYISDPAAITGGSIRTFVAQNQNQRPGVIFGVHEGAGGMLVCVTSAGVYGLDPSAFSVQIVGSNGTDWRLLNRNEAYSYDSSVNVRGRIYALTRRGFALVDVEGADEVSLDDPIVPTYLTRRAASPDWRTARIYEGDDGPVIADDAAIGSSGPAAHFVDLTTGVRSWWTCFVAGTSTSWKPRGILRDPDGAAMVLSEDGVYAIGGNVDGGQMLSTEAAVQGVGILFGAIRSDPDDNPTLRKVTWSASLGGSGSLIVCARGVPQTGGGGGTSVTPTADSRGLIIGTDSWGASGKLYEPTPMATASWDCNFNSADQSLELRSSTPSTRLGPVAVVDVSDSAPKRTPTRGAP
jgi:hypothetical protein